MKFLKYLTGCHSTINIVLMYTQDLNQFPSGDKTMIGERGLTLSGGQKTRINLARQDPIEQYFLNYNVCYYITHRIVLLIHFHIVEQDFT